MTVALACQRDLFEIPEEVAYLNAAAYVPLPRAVREAGQQGVLTKSHPWQMAGSHGMDISERARGAAAALLGTAADNVAITGAVSYGISTWLTAAAAPTASNAWATVIWSRHAEALTKWCESSDCANGPPTNDHRGGNSRRPAGRYRRSRQGTDANDGLT